MNLLELIHIGPHSRKRVENAVLVAKKSKRNNAILAMMLVGSAARGEATAQSDTDVLVVVKSGGQVDKVRNRLSAIVKKQKTIRYNPNSNSKDKSGYFDSLVISEDDFNNPNGHDLKNHIESTKKDSVILFKKK